MALAIRGMGRCWEDAAEQKRGPVSLGINLATGSTNRLSPPISRRHTDSYLYCQVAAATAAAVAAREKRGDSSKKPRRYRDSGETKCITTRHTKGPGSVRGSDSWGSTVWKKLPEVSCDMLDIFCRYFQQNENKEFLIFFLPNTTFLQPRVTETRICTLKIQQNPNFQSVAANQGSLLPP